MKTEHAHTPAEDIPADDPFYAIADQAGLAESDEALANGNAHLTNEDIDRALYGGS